MHYSAKFAHFAAVINLVKRGPKCSRSKLLERVPEGMGTMLLVGNIFPGIDNASGWKSLSLEFNKTINKATGG